MNYITDELFYSGDSVACFEGRLNMKEGLENLMLFLLVGLVLILVCSIAGRFCYVYKYSLDEELHSIDVICNHSATDNSPLAELDY